LSSCAYYNSMYNVKRYANQAQRSERAGRPAEAADRWRQVITHADTLLQHHPHSRWADDAQRLKGRAWVQLGGWSQAVGVLEGAMRATTDEEQRLETAYWLGLAYAGRRDYPSALTNLDLAVSSSNAARRSAARLARGRVLLLQGRPGEALSDFLAAGGPEARFERARASLAIGDLARAEMWAESAATTGVINEQVWIPWLDTLGRTGGAAAASRLVDAVASQAEIGVGPRARLMLSDGERLRMAGDDSGAVRRWTTVHTLAPDSAEGRIAEVRLMQQVLRGPDAVAQLAAIRARLDLVAGVGGEAAREASEITRLLGPVEPPTGLLADALAYERAEILRDSLGAPVLAAASFAALAAQHPESPWAAKALVAAIAAGHPAPDSLRRVLTDVYPESPYTHLAAGEPGDSAAFAALEDSLAHALAQLGGNGPRVGEPNPTAGDLEDEPAARNRRAQPNRPRPTTTPARPTPAQPTPRPTTRPPDPR
jgi:tetratricopeptide (TPR) repeat protein